MISSQHIGGQLGRARWASTGTTRESMARERPGLWPFGLVPCPCQAPGRAWASEAARGTSTGPARLVGRHVCGPFKRRSAPSSPSRRRSLAPLPLLRHAAAVSLAPLLSRAAAAAALLRPSRPPPQRCSPGRRRSSLLSPPVLPPSLPQRHRRPEPRRRGTRVCIPSTARPQLARLRPRLRRPLPPSPPAAAVAGRPPPPRADRCAARARRAQRHGTARRRPRRAVPGPGCRHGGTARHGTAAQLCLGVPVPAVLGPCPCRAARLATYTSNHQFDGLDTSSHWI